MGKVTKRRARPKYNYSIDRKKLWKKSKKLPAVQCAEMKANWDDRKSVMSNMADMGLSADPNKTLRIKTTKELIEPEEVDVTEIAKINKKPLKLHVAEALEENASIPGKKTKTLSEPIVLYCTYMLDKYGEDYKAMARDMRNVYQDTPKQIKKKITMFKNTPSQYEAYLKSKGKDT